MDEGKLLNVTLEILSKQGAESAYSYLAENQDDVTVSNRSQIYNFLYCLGAVCGKKDEALSWLEEAVITKGYWYRPEVFDDSDLETLMGKERFEVCKSVSLERYIAAKNTAKTICTWTKKLSDKILLALHGNQQNIEMSKEHWEFMKESGCQVEYIQSGELDSYQLYRWEDDGDGDNELDIVCGEIGWNTYGTRILSGFSAGCNVILKALMKNKIVSDYVILQSPWIPAIHRKMDDIIAALKLHKTKVLMICGENDEDCAPLVKALDRKAIESKADINTVWIKDLSHDFPGNFRNIVNEYLNAESK